MGVQPMCADAATRCWQVIGGCNFCTLQVRRVVSVPRALFRFTYSKCVDTGAVKVPVLAAQVIPATRTPTTDHCPPSPPHGTSPQITQVPPPPLLHALARGKPRLTPLLQDDQDFVG